MDDLNKRAWARMMSDPEEALSLAETALSDSESAGYPAGRAEARLNVGWCELYLNRAAAAIDSFQASLDGFSELQDGTGTIKSLNALGAVYFDMARYERAMDYYTRSLEEARRRGNRLRESVTLSNIGEVCLQLGELKEALDYFLRAYETVPDDRESELVSNVLLNIGTTFHSMENWQLAREFTEKALAISSAAGELYIECRCLRELGRVLQASDSPAEAESCYLRALALAERLKNGKERASILLDLGSLQLRRGEAEGALERFRVALAAAEAIGFKTLIHAAYERLSEAQEALGDWRTALDYYRRFARYEHEVLNEDAGRKIKNITVQYEVEKSRQEAEIYRLKNIELKEKTDALEEANRQLLAIAETGRRVTASLDLDTVCATVHDVLRANMPMDLFGLALHDEEEGSLEYRSYIEAGERKHRPRVKLDPMRSFAAVCVRERRTVFANDVDEAARELLSGKPLHHGQPAGSLLFGPLTIDERVIGIVTVQSLGKGAYTPEHLALLEALLPYASIAVENSLIHDRLEELNRAITGEKERLEEATVSITHQANHDTLTGLPNRRLLFELLQKTFDIASRSGGRVGVMFVDLDDFKPINDRYGHLAGDRALVAVASRLRSLLRVSDTVARVGGDEFVAVLANAGDRGAIERVARKLLRECRKPITVEGADCRVGLSMGIAVFPDDGVSVEQLLGAADAAMYRVKRGGKNGFAFCGSDASFSG